jgi:hypothetical protein
MHTRLLIVPSLLLLCMTCAHASAQDCGDLTVGVSGPFDYRTAPGSTLAMVEANHFTPDVERLIRGSTALTPAGDISFTLRVFPNHPGALLAMINDGTRLKTDKPPGSSYTVECWLDRAERFTPDDGKVELLYGIYFARKGNARGAVGKLSRAGELMGEDANVHYNLGLAYFDLHDYEQALVNAQAAYGLGFPLPGLRKKLQSVGKWQPAVAPSPASVAPSAPSPEPDPTQPPVRSDAEAPVSGRPTP